MGAQSVPWIMVAVFAILLLLLAVFIIFSRNAKQKKAVDNTTVGHIPALKKQVDADKVRRIGLIAGTLALIVGIGVFFLAKSSSTGGGSDSDDNSFFPIIPIWIAIFVPLLANKKKQKSEQKITARQKRILTVTIALVLGVVLAFISFIIFNK